MANDLNSSISADAAAEVARSKETAKARYRSNVLDTFPDMAPADVEAAVSLLADDLRLDREAMASLADASRSGQEVAEGRSAVAVPAAALLLVARCAMGSMSSVAVDELYSLIVHRKTASATDRIQSAIVGCLTGPGLSTATKWVVRRFGTRIVAAALVVAIKLRRICIPRCI